MEGALERELLELDPGFRGSLFFRRRPAEVDISAESSSSEDDWLSSAAARG